MFFYVLLFVLALILICLHFIVQPKKFCIEGSHVLITGGSSGIGRALAIEAAKRKANVSIFARNEVKLREAVTEIEQFIQDNAKQKVAYFSCDVSGDYQTVADAVAQAENKLGPVDILINNAGLSAAGRFEDVPLQDFQKLMTVNYMGCVQMSRAVIRGMKQRESGRIVFVSSQAGQLGVFGYTPYSPTKFALRGLAEALQMEVTPYNIRVTVSFPPDTETPGFREEMDSGLKPEETTKISETSGLFEASVVAKITIDDTLAGKFQSYIGLDGWMLSTMAAGMSPFTSLKELLEQMFLMSVMRTISFFYLMSFDSIVKKCKGKRVIEDSKKDK